MLNVKNEHTTKIIMRDINSIYLEEYIFLILICYRRLSRITSMLTNI
jgi:hypothetical protein